MASCARAMGRPGKGADRARRNVDAEMEKRAEEVLVKCIVCADTGVLYVAVKGELPETRGRAGRSHRTTMI